jgi:hypothetical protein
MNQWRTPEYRERKVPAQVTYAPRLPRRQARGIPPTYAELLGVLVPRAIHDAVEFQSASEIMNSMAGHELNEDQGD